MSEEYTVENSHGHYLLYPGGAYAEKAVTSRQADALRKKFFEEAGLWLDSVTGALVVVVDSWADGSAFVVRDSKVYVGDMYTTRVDGQIVRRWRESLVPPPRMPEVGDVWRVTLQDESEHYVVVRRRWLDNSLVFVGIPGAILTDVEDIPPDRRRFVAGADGNAAQDV